MKFFIITTLLLAFETLIAIGGKCPKDEDNHLIYPCVCFNNSHIFCNTTEDLHLKRVFDYISATVFWSERSYKSLTIESPKLSQLDEISLSDTLFEEIVINNAKNLSKIHTNAFGRARLTVKKLVINGADQLSTQSSDYNFFDVLSSFPNIQTIQINGINIKEIPDYAFKPLLGRQWALNNITLKGAIERIGNYAFYEYPYHLTRITVGNGIKSIASHAFDMRFWSFQRVTIDLSDNLLTADSFEAGVFMNTKRVLYVDISDNRLTHLDEFIFEPFLSQDILNQINVKGNHFNCDCRLKWLLNGKHDFERQVLNVICSDGRPLWSHSPQDLNECKISDNVIQY